LEYRQFSLGIKNLIKAINEVPYLDLYNRTIDILYSELYRNEDIREFDYWDQINYIDEECELLFLRDIPHITYLFLCDLRDIIY